MLLSLSLVRLCPPLTSSLLGGFVAFTTTHDSRGSLSSVPWLFRTYRVCPLKIKKTQTKVIISDPTLPPDYAVLGTQSRIPAPSLAPVTRQKPVS